MANEQLHELKDRVMRLEIESRNNGLAIAEHVAESRARMSRQEELNTEAKLQIAAACKEIRSMDKKLFGLSIIAATLGSGAGAAVAKLLGF